MQVEVLQIRTTGKGFNVAHIKCGNLFGDCLAADDVTQPGVYALKSTLRVKDGRLVALLRVEKPQ